MSLCLGSTLESALGGGALSPHQVPPAWRWGWGTSSKKTHSGQLRRGQTCSEVARDRGRGRALMTLATVRKHLQPRSRADFNSGLLSVGPASCLERPQVPHRQEAQQSNDSHPHAPMGTPLGEMGLLKVQRGPRSREEAASS